MKHIATIDITSYETLYNVTIHFDKKCRTFKVRTLKEAMQKCEAMIEEHKAKPHVRTSDCQNPNKNSE